MTRSSDRRAARRPAAATPRKVVRSTVAALVSAPGAAYRTAAAVALAALIGGAPVHAETPRLGPDVFEPDFIASALAGERETLALVASRRGAVDLDAVEGRVTPRSGMRELEHLSIQDRAMLASLQRGGSRAAAGLTGVAGQGRLAWADFDKLAAKGDAQWACLTEALYFEARGETLAGQVAVAEVILNRVDRADYPNTVCKVVRQGASTARRYACQFSYKCDGKSDAMNERGAYKRVGKVARAMMDGRARTITDGATHYHADHVRPRWAKKFPKTASIGDHIFYRAPGAYASR
ncbi:Cell Wall Hydrolase [Albimonas donghaensis]|uniref:Cell Wall Hydrolase n=1 Tax=Albimonas donghaensis TaxID=356660 RepID=A0A1H2RSF3_9RHOB|nr:Cell Wall Hydrolase [Albimonas donghaensis]